MYECLICYDLKANSEEMSFLECSHSLCSTCLAKLQKNTCPFCRTTIESLCSLNSIEIVPELPRYGLERYSRYRYEQQSIIRVRRRRSRAQTTTEIIDTEHGIIIIETPHYHAREKKSRKYEVKSHLSSFNKRSRGSKILESINTSEIHANDMESDL